MNLWFRNTNCHQVMKKKDNSAETCRPESVRCSKFESGPWKLRIQPAWIDLLPFVTWRRIFLPRKFSLINIRGNKCDSPGVASLGRNKIGTSREIARDSLSLIDWLGRSIAWVLVCLFPNNGNNGDNLTPSRNVLWSSFVNWANMSAVIASNLHQWC